VKNLYNLSVVSIKVFFNFESGVSP